MEKSEKQLIEEANDIIRSFLYVIERKGFNTNWDGLSEKTKKILKEQHKYLYPTLKNIRKQKLLKINSI